MDQYSAFSEFHYARFPVSLPCRLPVTMPSCQPLSTAYLKSPQQTVMGASWMLVLRRQNSTSDYVMSYIYALCTLHMYNTEHPGFPMLSEPNAA